MNRVARELESIALAAVAAVPLYLTSTVSVPSVALFHLILTMIAVRIMAGGDVPHYPPRFVKLLGYAYVIILPLDFLIISRDVIRSSTHLLFFIIVYLVLDAAWEQNYSRRLLVTGLLFVTSIATSTHLSVVVFMLLFSFLMFRQLIHVSHFNTAASVAPGAPYPPSSRPAAFYLLASSALAIMMFPFLPRVGSPVVPGLTSTFNAASTGISNSINFSERRSISLDPAVVARVWMNRESVPFFIPLRLRAAVYDRFRNGEWVTSHGSRREPIVENSGTFQIARPVGFTRSATVQQTVLPHNRLLLPVGTYAVAGVPDLYRDSNAGLYGSSARSPSTIEYQVGLSREVVDLGEDPGLLTNYPIAAPVEEFARTVAGKATTPREMAAKIESYLSTRFTYVANPADLAEPVSVDRFLLSEHRGHCEYFAAGMVVMLQSLGVPARIVGGFYGGELNPLTGYFRVRRSDAHAWVEVFDGARWQTYDPTPAAQRPGQGSASLFRSYASAVGDSVEFFWDRYVLTFGTEDQITLLIRAIRTVRELRRVATATGEAILAGITLRAVLGVALTVLALVLVITVMRRRRQSSFSQMLDELWRLGFELDETMTSEDVLGKVSALRPDLREIILRIVEPYRVERFSREVLSPERSADSRQALRDLAGTR